MAYFKYSGKNVFYSEVGEGKPIIFLHGNTASSNMFLGIEKLFIDKYKVIMIDFLGHGKSERVKEFKVDLWFDEALQVIAFLEQMGYKKVNLIGSSGGAIVAINVALERPDLVDKVIADSFEGETPLFEFVKNIKEEREVSKKDEETKSFYYTMHAEDWESVVDNDTNAIYEHLKIGKFYHKSLSEFKPLILLTGSKEDEFLKFLGDDFYEQTYKDMLKKIGHGKMHMFEKGSHPAIISNPAEFTVIAKKFFDE